MREDIPDLMRAMDVFVLSSLSEGISLTLLEAMSCCLPVVATEVGGNPEVVVDGVTGFLVPSQQPELLADKLRIMITENGLRQQMGASGRQRVIDCFSLTTTSEKYRAMYFDLLGQPQ
jgi:glycosyltransferase involved in cell wall biosynthesis